MTTAEYVIFSLVIVAVGLFATGLHAAITAHQWRYRALELGALVQPLREDAKNREEALKLSYLLSDKTTYSFLGNTAVNRTAEMQRNAAAEQLRLALAKIPPLTPEAELERWIRTDPSSLNAMAKLTLPGTTERDTKSYVDYSYLEGK